jgi:hypothetical protein
MNVRTVVCQFPTQSPKLSAFDINEWIFVTLQLPEDEILMVKIDGPTQCVHINYVTSEKIDNHLSRILGQHEYKHPTGEITQIHVQQIGLGYRSVRHTGLTPEVSDSAIVIALSRYEEITSIKAEMCMQNYRYKVATAAWNVHINLKTHLPSQVHIAGYKTLAQYDGQKLTRFTCQEIRHITSHCPYRRMSYPCNVDTAYLTPEGSWAGIVRHDLNRNGRKI